MNIFSRSIFAVMLCLCVHSVVFAESQSEGNEGITEQKIINFMKAQDDALMRGDVAAVILGLADNWVSTSKQQGKEDKKSTRSELEASLVKNLPQMGNYQIKHEDIKIKISEDGRSAVVTQKDIQSFTIKDRNAIIVSLSTQTFEQRGEKIVNTSAVDSILEVEVQLKVRDVAERPTDCTYFPENEMVAQYQIDNSRSGRTMASFFGVAKTVPFCRMYRSDAKTVSGIVQSIILSMGNPIKVADIANGFFTTDVMERNGVMSAWQDSYSITVQAANTGESVVRILRTLRVSTDSGFELTPSDGHNEKWILSQITERILSQKDVTKPPSTSVDTSVPSSGATSVEDQLKKLESLHERKIITDEEYKAMRAKALGL